MSFDPLTAAFDLGKIAIEKIWPDPSKQAAEMLKITELKQSGDIEKLHAYVNTLTARMGIIKAEANSEHFIVAAWRPILMLTFGGLVVMRWFGFTAEGISEAEYLELWGIIKIGIGGYVGGRSAEKIAKVWKG